MLKVAPCPARPALAGSPAATVPGARGAPHQESPPWGLAQVPPPKPRPRPRGTALSLQVPRRVEGPRAEELPKPSGMGAGGAASHSLAWASLPLLGPPAGALCEDTLCCRGKTGPAAPARLSLFPGTCWSLFLFPYLDPRRGKRGWGWGDCQNRRGNRSRAWGEESGALCKLTFDLKKVAVAPPRSKSSSLPLASVFLSGKWDNKTVPL